MLSRVQLCNPMNCSPPGFPVHGIFQAKTMDSVSISYSRGSSRPRNGPYVSSISWIGRWIFFFTMALPGKSEVHCWRLGCDLKKCCTWFVEKEMATHSSTLAWKTPWTEEPGRLQSMGSRRIGHNWETLLSFFTLMPWRRKWQPTPVFLPGESQRQRSLVGFCLWSRTRSDTTEVT